MEAAVRNFVRSRAGNRCEYCRSNQDDEPFAQFQIEHVIARQHGGSDAADNLALACSNCNLHKGPNLAGLDPLDGALVRLFNPRRDRW
jgi:5-methylcytosine-specific restriction endonuclease McrA